MKVVYLSDKYRDARGPWYVLQNVAHARKIAVELWQMGFAVICPHSNTMFMEGPIDDPVIIAGDCEMVCCVDGLVVGPHWETSVGTKTEMQVAWETGKPIFYWDTVYDKDCLQHWANDDYNLKVHMILQRQYSNPVEWITA